MKTPYDPRHKRRVKKFKRLFAYSFLGRIRSDDEELKPVIEHIGEIDAKIQEVAPEWPVNRLNRVDLALLRLSVYELLYKPSTPPKVVIDEAVEIGKEYGSESTAKFVNGVLGTLLEQTGYVPDQEEEEKVPTEDDLTPTELPEASSSDEQNTQQ